ncbi:uncharacterized protein LOC125041211 [Penaeus chinensis]|uniref:uncharacterized protein LOC125041211 n=1 Tax=Penaeus chinensis TaxID=139456 RepID=UPI001FB59C2B|nr:uncharacterized protein LOC125041211 [Penaeus chinensis]
METEKMPDEWRESTLIPIFKNKGDIEDCGKYRGIKLMDLYEGSKANVKCMVGTRESFQVKVGLHQGSALSPFLFAIVIDCLIEAVQKIAPWDLMFADDVALNGETSEDVEERLEQWRSALEDRGMKVSRHKTEYLCMGDQDPERAVEMQGLKLNRVQEFKYLGSTVQSDGASIKEIGKRIQAGWNAWRKITGLLCDRRVPAKLKGRIFKTMVRPVMLYGMEAVAVTKGQERKMEVAEMRMLRFSLGKTRLDRVRNSTIRENGVGELEKKLRECRYKLEFRTQHNKKERRIVVEIPADSDVEDFDDSLAGHSRFIGGDKKLSVRDPDICSGSILPEHTRYQADIVALALFAMGMGARFARNMRAFKRMCLYRETSIRH